MYERYNHLVLNRLSDFLNNEPAVITKQMVEQLTSLGIDSKQAFEKLFVSMLDLECLDEGDREVILEKYVPEMLHCLNVEVYSKDDYYANVHLKTIYSKRWTITRNHYSPYEIFVCNDLIQKEDGRIIPQIGYFEEDFFYDVINQNDREWMLITPNEIETMKEPIHFARGSVCTYGLGLGYYAYHVSNKKEVVSVTIVEKDIEVISLFKKWILPQFPNKDKIKIINKDAIEYAKKKKYFDSIFVDIWHDVGDGLPLYHQFKKYERNDVKYHYWIEKTMKCYE